MARRAEWVASCMGAFQLLAAVRASLFVQYWWVNKGYTSFDDFLMHLRQSKRKNIRQVCGAECDVVW